ncbi:MAG: YbbR-like domain-containing protein [Candidatus Binatia bacterium]
MGRYWKRIVSITSSNIGLKLFSFAFALGIWLYLNAGQGQKAAEKAVEVPVELRNIPSDVMVVNPGPGQVEIRVAGTPALLSAMDQKRLKVVLDLARARPGTSTFRLSPDFFDPPRGIRIRRISPSVIDLWLEAVIERSLPITVRFGGKPPFGYKVGSVKVNPKKVKVRGPANEIEGMTTVDTLPFDLQDAKEEVTRELRIASAGKLLTVARDRVVVSVAIEEEWITKEFERVKIEAREYSGQYRVTPSQVYLRLSGPKRVLDQFKVGKDQVYLELNGLEPGQYTLEPSLDLPPEVKVVEQKPARFEVRILDSERR